jgi:hypothetical protein
MAHHTHLHLAWLTLLMSGAPSASYATEWVSIGTVDSSFGPSQVELDADSIKQSTSTPIPEELEFQLLHSKVRSAWFRLSFAPVEIERQAMSSALMRININCDTNSTQTEALIAYAGTRGRGKRLAATDSAYRTPWVDIVPDSLQDIARQELCASE